MMAEMAERVPRELKLRGKKSKQKREREKGGQKDKGTQEGIFGKFGNFYKQKGQGDPNNRKCSQGAREKDLPGQCDSLCLRQN